MQQQAMVVEVVDMMIVVRAVAVVAMTIVAAAVVTMVAVVVKAADMVVAEVDIRYCLHRWETSLCYQGYCVVHRLYMSSLLCCIVSQHRKKNWQCTNLVRRLSDVNR